MKGWKRAAINGYRIGTWPYRNWMHRQFASQSAFPVGVLFYHRVADQQMTDWTISCAGFEEQIDWLQSRFDLISLSEAQKRLREKRSPRPAVAITFDDGYADNNLFALPLLIRRQIPVTYFVSVDHVFNDVPFPHDAALGFDLSRNNLDSLRELSRCGVEIGAHTRTHLRITSEVDEETLQDELIEATKDLEAGIKQPVRYFAVPFGRRENMEPRVLQMASNHGFEGICSAYGGLNFPGHDAFHLQRIHGDPELARLKNWLTWDPRVLRIQPDPVQLQRPQASEASVDSESEERVEVGASG